MKIQFSLSIPDWLYRFRWVNVKNYCSFFINPPKCHVCGTRVNLRTPEMRWLGVNGYKEMMGQASIDGQITKCLCKSCVVDAVSLGQAIPKHGEAEYGPYETTDECDHCGAHTTSYKWTAFKYNGHTINLILGNYCSWNSAYYCKECISKIFNEGTETSGVVTLYEGKMVPLNHLGLPVVNNKVKFPLR